MWPSNIVEFETPGLKYDSQKLKTDLEYEDGFYRDSLEWFYGNSKEQELAQKSVCPKNASKIVNTNLLIT